MLCALARSPTPEVTNIEPNSCHERPNRLGARHRLERIHDDFERPRPERYSFIIRAWRRSISALKALGRDGCRL